MREPTPDVRWMANFRLPSGFAARLPEIGALMISVVIAAALWLGIEYRARIASVQHTLEVQTALQKLRSAIQNAEIGQRSYVLTGDDAFLEPWRDAPAEISRNIDIVRRMTADNSEQGRAIAELAPLIEKRLELSRARIAQRRSGDFDGAVREIRTQTGLKLFQGVEQLISGMEETEQKLLRSRETAAAFAVRRLSIAAFIGLVITIAVLSYWIWRARRDAAELSAAHALLLATMAEREAAESQLRQAQKMEAVGQLTGGLAHDFNNMLAVILSGLNLIGKRLAKGQTDVGNLLEAAVDAATRAASLTKRLLAFARQQPLSPEAIDANRLVAGMAEILRRTLGETIAIETVSAGGLWPTHADAGQLENAILNVCLNARDAMPNGGKLTIETANAHLDDAYAREHGVPAGQYVLIAISDTGDGMTPDVMAKAFEPFFTTKPVGGGSGLGLSQVYGFVRQTGGHAKIYSEVGHGATVKMYLPRFYPATKLQNAQPAPNEGAESLAHGDPREIILVVEDEPRVLDIACASLRDLGYTVIRAGGAAQALRQLDAHPNTTLLFTDIVMPEMNGRALADEALKRKPDLKVLFTTGFSKNAVVHNGVLDPGVRFLAKPYTLEQLAAKVREALSG